MRFNGHRLTFWPLSHARRRSLPVGSSSTWSIEFTPNGRWLAACPFLAPARLWPMGADDGTFRDLTPSARCFFLAVDSAGTRVLTSTSTDERGSTDGRVFLYPIEGGTRRQLQTGWEGELASYLVAFDERGRRAMALPQALTGAQEANLKARTFRVWDLETGTGRTIPVEDARPFARFAPDGSVIYRGPGGLRRLVLPGTDGDPLPGELLFSYPDEKGALFTLSRDGRQLLLLGGRRSTPFVDDLILVDLASRTSRRITTHGARLAPRAAFDPSGRFIVTGDHDGVVRVGPVTGEEPHLLLGHTGLIESIAVSPDGRWIASAAEDQLFLWPTPDVTKPPLHTLPHDQLLSTLDGLTNLRVVPDASASTGWKLEVGPFPGWKEVPGW